MKVLVCGGRNYNDQQYLFTMLDRIHELKPITCIIQGEARGADTLGKQWAVTHNVEVESYPADWDTHGKRAGYLRNVQMLVHGKPEIVVAFPGGKGTANMLDIAQKAGVRTLDLRS